MAAILPSMVVGFTGFGVLAVGPVMTLLDAAGVAPDERMQGGSFWGDLLGQPGSRSEWGPPPRQ